MSSEQSTEPTPASEETPTTAEAPSDTLAEPAAVTPPTDDTEVPEPPAADEKEEPADDVKISSGMDKKATEAKMSSLNHFEPTEETFAKHRADLDYLREFAGVAEDDPIINDTFIYRFLRGYQFDKKKAFNALKASLDYRKEQKLTDLRTKYTGTQQSDWPHAIKLQKFWPHTVYHGEDKKGQPLSLDHFGKCNPNYMVKFATLEELIEYQHAHVEHKAEFIARLSEEKKCVMRAVKVINLEGLGSHHMNRQGLKMFGELVKIAQKNYPEMAAEIYIVNAPKIFTLFWRVVRPVLQKHTLEKIFILGAAYQDTLLEHIPAESLPVELGGTCECPGGCIKIDDPDAGLTEVVIKARGSTKITLDLTATGDVKEPGEEGLAMVSWDFYTVSNNVGFTCAYEGEEPLFAHAKIDSHKQRQTGSISMPKTGRLVFTFDNSYSRFTKKTLRYRIDCTLVREDDPLRFRVVDDEE